MFLKLFWSRSPLGPDACLQELQLLGLGEVGAGVVVELYPAAARVLVLAAITSVTGVVHTARVR